MKKIVVVAFLALYAPIAHSQTCKPEPSITGTYANSCRNCTVDSSCNILTCYCDNRNNKTTISLAVCETHHFCNAGGFLQCGDGCHD